MGSLNLTVKVVVKIPLLFIEFLNLKGSYKFIQIQTESYRVIKRPTESNRVIQCHTDLYRVTQSHRVSYTIHYDRESYTVIESHINV